MRFTNLLVVAALGFVVFAALPKESEREQSTAGQVMLNGLGLEFENSNDAHTQAISSDKPSFGIHIRHPAGPPVVELGGVDLQGNAGQVACPTCHSIREPNFDNIDDTTLDEIRREVLSTIAVASAEIPLADVQRNLEWLATAQTPLPSASDELGFRH